MSILSRLLCFAPLVGALWSCSGAPTVPPATASSTQTAVLTEPLAQSYYPLGQAGLDRLQQSDMQAICSEHEGRALPPQVAARLMAEAREAVVMPADGRFLGDWRAGEIVAKSGVGLQSSDSPTIANGGNCYACHQMAAEEIAYGTLGPPLGQYGKLRGDSTAMLEFAWTRLWNPHVYNACSHMPRFGDAAILTEQQLKDVMAYLFDPASPVNMELSGEQ